MIEKDERAIQERNAQAQQEQIQSQQQIAQMQQQQKQAELEQKEQANIRDNETKVLIASMSANMQPQEFEESEFSEEAKSNLEEKIREFDAKLKLDRDKLNLDKQKATTDAQIKREQLKKKPVTNNK